MCFDGNGLGLFFRTGDGDNGAKRREKLDSLIKEWGEGEKGGVARFEENIPVLIALKCIGGLP